MNKVIIGIPIYQQNLSVTEEVALNQVISILGKYKIVFIAPDKLDFVYHRNLEIIRFADKFFKSRESYSELLLSKEFYWRIQDYKFLLIYQLDAFVFKDELDYFCNLGYDYIGAPQKGHDWSLFHVGNGGLSLRNIKKSLKMVQNKDFIVKKMYSLMQYNYFAEDVFFSYCGYDKELDYKVPSVRIAAKFSTDCDLGHGLRDIDKRGLPFGCHYWPVLNYNIWKPYIESFGYNLPDIRTVNSLAGDRGRRTAYLCRRYIRSKRWLKADDYLMNTLCDASCISIYGAGKWGQKCIDFLREVHVYKKIICIYDKKRRGNLAGIPVLEPQKNKLREKESFIIISTPLYEDEIRSMLKDWNLQEGKDFVTLTSMLHCSYNLRRV